MVRYTSAGEYVESCSGLKAKIAAIDAIIQALLVQALKAAEKGAVSQYSLNDGQVIISSTYRSAEEVSNSINAFRRLKNEFIFELYGGRVRRLVDSKNFTGPINGRNR